MIVQNLGSGGFGVSISQAVGQSFTAEDPKLQTIGFYFESYIDNSPDAQIKCELLQGEGFGGAVLATSVAHAPPSLKDFVTFDFSSAPGLTVGQKYTTRLTPVGTNQFMVGWNQVWGVSDPYAGGYVFVNGGGQEYQDLRFRIVPAGLEVVLIGFETNELVALEPDQGISIPVKRAGSTQAAAEISYKTSVPFLSGAAPGRHYQAQQGSLRFEPGESSKTIIIPITNDETFDTNKVFDVELSSSDSAILLNISRLRVEIRDDDGIQIFFTEPTFTLAEDVGNATITVERYGKPQQSLTLQYEVQNGSAINGDDFIGAPGELTIGPNQTRASFVVAILPDRTVEDEEHFFVRVSSPSANTNITAWVRLSDRTALAEFPAAIVNSSEAAGTVSIPVVRRGYGGKEMTLAYRTEPLTATAGQDYTSAEGQLIFAAGELEKTIHLTVLDDTVAEPTESFLVKLLPSGPVDYIGNRTAMSITLSNNSSLVYFVATNVSVSETRGTARVLLHRGGLLSIESTILYVTGPESAEPGVDYTPHSGQLTFAPDQAEGLIEIPILDDLLPEPDEMFTVTLSAGSANLTLTNREAQITIIDNSSIVGFASTNLSVLETSGSIRVEVRRTGDSSQASAINYATEDRTARAGVHYTAASGILNFAAGEAAKQIIVPILDNDLPESDVLFAIRLFNPTQESKLGTASTAQVLIGNDDQTVQFTRATFSAFMGSQSAQITLNRGPSALGAVSVRVTTSDGTAKAGEDFQALNQIVGFESGQSSATFATPLINPDDPAKIGRHFTVQIGEPVGARLGNPSKAVVTFSANRDYHFDHAFADRASEFGNIGTPMLIGAQPDGKILFKAGAGIRRANADGSPDATFQSVDASFGALQSDGSILWSSAVEGGRRVQRLSKDGVPDPSFVPITTDYFTTLLWVDPLDRIYFRRRNDIGRASNSGIVDAQFSMPAVSELAFDSEGRIYSHSANGVRRHTSEGIQDKEFQDPEGQIQSIQIAPGSKVMCVVSSNGKYWIRRLSSELILDPTWNESASRLGNPVDILALSDGKVLGYSQWPSRLMIFDEDGSLNEEFVQRYGRNNSLSFRTIEQAPGSFIMAGDFYDLEFKPAPFLARYSIFAEPALFFSRDRFRGYNDQPFAQAQVRREGDLASAASVRVLTEDGSLMAGIHFSDLEQIIEFPPEDTVGAALRALLVQPSPAGNFFAILDQPEGAVLAKPARAEVQVLPVPAGEFVLDLNFNARTGPVDKRFDVAATFAIQPGYGILASIFAPAFFLGGDIVIRLNSDGSMDNSFAPISTRTTNGISHLSVAGDRVYLSTWGNLQRFLPDGTPDSSFSRAISSASAILRMPSGKFLVATGQQLRRLNEDGSNDPTFGLTTLYAQIPSEPISKIALQTDGKALVAGATLWRVNANGGLDATFPDPAPNRYISDIALQTDGKILVGGGFYSIAGKLAPGLARLNPDGSRDETFSASLETDAWVYSIALQPNGSMVIGGNFQKNLKRLMPNGAEDTTFTSVAPNAAVTKVEFEDSENLLISGYFTEPGQGLARLTTRRSAARFSALSLTPAGALKVQLQGKSGLSYDLLKSADLQNWEIWTRTNLPADSVSFTVPARNSQRLFLRAVQSNPPQAR